MVNLWASAYTRGNDRDRDAGGCDNAHTLSRGRKGRRGRRRHWCISDTSNNLKYRPNGDGHNPCRGVGRPRYVGGGVHAHGYWRNYTGKGRNFRNAPFGLRCEGVRINDAVLRSWSGNGHILATGVNDSRGGFKNLWDQAVYGVVTDVGSTGGYCQNIAHLNRVIHRNGSTCFDTIKNAAQRKTKGIQFCRRYPRDRRCKCINVAGSGFVDKCKKNPKLPGCNEVVKGIKEFEKAGLKSATGLFGNADCIVPGVCSGDVFQPLSGVPACANKTAICNQVMNLDNIKAAAGVKALQGCNINFEAEQKKKDAAKAKAAADAKAKAEAEAKAKAKAAAEAKAKAEAEAKAKAGAGGRAPTGTAVATKTNGGGLPGGISPVQGGVVSFSLFCCSLIILLIVLRMGGKGNNK
jgi:ribosomal protein L12E/L44/L45/RPP1/RPP2